MTSDQFVAKNRSIRVASLFSGCGGLDLGFTGGFDSRGWSLPKTGFEVVFANDFDADAAFVYRSNPSYLNAEHFLEGDIREVPANDVPDFDVLLAGFPCQPFSNAGSRQGIDDKGGRGTLFYECERILKHCAKLPGGLMPQAFVFENVRGIMSTKMPGKDRTVPEEIERRMSNLGYNVVTKLLKASHYGVPQSRYRVLIIGVREDLPPFDFSLLDQVARKAGLPSELDSPDRLTLGSVLCDIPRDAPQREDYWKYSPGGQRMVDLIGPCLDGGEALKKFKKRTPVDEISDTIRQGKSWKNIDPSDMSPRFRKIHDNPQTYRAPNFYRRFALGEIAGTITASAQPENCGITHPFENRRMTVREIARIQTFPDDFSFPSRSMAAPYKVIGNAVPPVLGWVIAMALKQVLKG